MQLGRTGCAGTVARKIFQKHIIHINAREIERKNTEIITFVWHFTFHDKRNKILIHTYIHTLITTTFVLSSAWVTYMIENIIWSLQTSSIFNFLFNSFIKNRGVRMIYGQKCDSVWRHTHTYTEWEWLSEWYCKCCFYFWLSKIKTKTK